MQMCESGHRDNMVNRTHQACHNRQSDMRSQAFPHTNTNVSACSRPQSLAVQGFKIAGGLNRSRSDQSPVSLTCSLSPQSDRTCRHRQRVTSAGRLQSPLAGSWRADWLRSATLRAEHGPDVRRRGARCAARLSVRHAMPGDPPLRPGHLLNDLPVSVTTS